MASVPTAPITDFTGLYRYLVAHAALDSDPKLSPDDTASLMRRHQRATIWAAGTDYAIGQRVQVMKTPLNALYWPLTLPAPGVYFRCLQAGTVGDTEPGWFNQDGYFFGSALFGVLRIADGGVVWAYDGLAMPDLWDLGAMVHDCWMLKAGKVAGLYDVSSAQQSVKRSQMYDHCVAMANRYAPVFLV